MTRSQNVNFRRVFKVKKWRRAPDQSLGGGDAGEAFVVTASLGEDLSFLALSEGRVSTSGLDVFECSIGSPRSTTPLEHSTWGTLKSRFGTR